MEKFKTCIIRQLPQGYSLSSKSESGPLMLCEYSVVFTPRICLKMCELYATIYEHLRCDKKLTHEDACFELAEFFNAQTSKEMRVPDAKEGFDFVVNAKAYYPKGEQGNAPKID